MLREERWEEKLNNLKRKKVEEEYEGEKENLIKAQENLKRKVEKWEERASASAGDVRLYRAATT